ncbi:MAG: hypothetical protein LH466_08955 [Sphingomonas bacterium]|nr:hypothetical protein [Sphingomonas bacterium]
MPRSSPVFKLAAVALIGLVICALLVPFNHDEGQYVAASALVARGLMPFVDFAYLQTPVQPYVYAPLEWLAPGWHYLAVRLANAVAVAAALLLLGKTAGRLAGDDRAGWIAIMLAMFCDSVLFAGSVARNDALPFLLLTASLERLFGGADEPGRGRVFIAGVLAALAASTKISYAFPAAAIGLQTLIAVRRGGFDRKMAILAGLFLGGLPILIFLALAPKSFFFGVYTYSLDAVRAWQTLSGHAHRTGILSRFARVLRFLIQGSLLPLCLAALWIRLRAPRTVGAGQRLGIGLGPILLAALVGVVLPMPPYRHYMVPLVAPLLLWLAAHGWTSLAPLLDRPRLPRALVAGIAIIAVGGLTRTANDLVRAPLAKRPLQVERQAHQIGRLLALAGPGEIAGLEPSRLIDSGVPFDRRFAAGPFLFRAGNLPACADPTLCPVTFASVDRLNQNPPTYVVTGQERLLPIGMPGGLDGALVRWARGNGFVEHTLGGHDRLWIAPRSAISGRNFTAHDGRER